MKVSKCLIILLCLHAISIGCSQYTEYEKEFLEEDFVHETKKINYNINNTMNENFEYSKQNQVHLPTNFRQDNFVKTKCPEFYNKMLNKYNDAIYEVTNHIYDKQGFVNIYKASLKKYLKNIFDVSFSSTSYKKLGKKTKNVFNERRIKNLTNSIEDLKFDMNIKTLKNDILRIELTYNRWNYTAKKIVVMGTEDIHIDLSYNKLLIERDKSSTVDFIKLTNLKYVLLNRLSKKNKFYDIFIKNVQNKIGDTYKRYSDLIDDAQDKLSLVEIDDKQITCYLLTKESSLNDRLKDLKIDKINFEHYKNKKYFTLHAHYMNVFNNINIKFNDQYKIARYIYDHIVRQGLRSYSDIYNMTNVNGISFYIIATDKNFIDESEKSNYSLYKYYLSQKKSLQYINDNITGQDLADSSFILVDGERIELK